MIKEQLGIYIHIPFCLKKCDYCDFYSIKNDASYHDEYVLALVNELDSYIDEISDRFEISSIYFGGGTPTTLTTQNIGIILDKIFTLDVSPDAEITVEANPETLSYSYLEELYKLKVNRLSIGMQSLSDKFLKQIGRIHTKEKFLTEYNNAKKVGFDNINIDVMFGFYNQSLEDVKETILEVIKLRPTHISSYSLILEEDTKMYDDYLSGKINLISEELERDMYYFITDTLQKNGYERYEISNYSLDGFQAKHNCAYWQNTKYIGLGASASSYFLGKRYKNENDVLKYIKNNGILEKIDVENISIKEEIEEFFFLGLRMKKGVTNKNFFDRFNQNINDYFSEEIDKLIKDNLLSKEDDRIFLTNKGFDLSNYVLSHFIIDDL